MGTPGLLHLAAWAACLSAAAAIVTLVTGIRFFVKGQPFGTINDAASVFHALFTLPLAWALHFVLGWRVPILSGAAAALGSLGLLAIGVLQALLVLQKVTFEQTFSVVLASGHAMGVWLIVVSGVALASGVLPGALVWVGTVAGSAYAMSAVAYSVSGKQGPLFFLSAATGLVAYSVWAI